jgi:prepilin-type N-terminal cleavage/methylation domain-containing protein
MVLNNSMKKIIQSGFTLLELMVVIAMIGVLMAVGIPSFRAMLTTNEMADTTNELMLSLRKARAEAISSGRNTIVCSSTDGATCSGAAGNWNQGWLVMVDRNIDGSYLVANDELLWVHELKSNTTITITPSPTTATIGVTSDFTDTVTFSYTGELDDDMPGEFHLCSGAGGSGFPRREISVSVGGEASLFKNNTLATNC